MPSFRTLSALLLAGLGLASGAFSQTASPYSEAWRWVHFSTEDGLSLDPVTLLAYDAKGTPWAASNNGLTWYDGYVWHPVTTELGVPKGRVHSLTPLPSGRILASVNGKLFEGDRQGFTYRPAVLQGDTLSVFGAVMLDASALLLSDNKQLYRYEHGEVTPFPMPDAFPSGGILGGITQPQGSSVWLFSPHGLFEWVGHHWERWSSHSINFVHRDEAGVIFNINDAIHRRGIWAGPTFDTAVLLPDQSGQTVRAVDVDDRGNGLVVYGSGDVRIRDNGTWRWLDPVPEPLRAARQLHFTPDGNLWVSTPRGLYLYRANATRWSRMGEHPHDFTAHINAILKTKDGDLWLGTQKGLVIHRKAGSIDRIEAINGAALDEVTGLAQDRDGHVWVSSGSSFSGAYRFDGTWWNHYGKAEGLDAPSVHRVALDRQGRPWFLGLGRVFGGTADDPEPGAFVFDGHGFTRWGEPEGLLSGRVYSFTEDHEGAYWFGTLKGLSRWYNGTWTHITPAHDNLLGRVFTLTADDKGGIWFGHYGLGGGLGHYDAAGNLTYYTSDDGLASEQIWDVHFDGDIWLGTSAGLGRMHQGVFSFLGHTQGLLHPYLWPILPTPERVYVGTAGGGLYVLDRAVEHNPPPRLSIQPPGIIGQSAYLRWSVQAYWGEMGRDVTPTRYRLDDGPWSPWSHQRDVRLPSLSYGTHVFTVQSKNLMGVIGTPPTTQALVIPTPFYAHPLFLLGILASIVGLGFLYRSRHIQEAERRRHLAVRLQEAQEAERRSLSQALHDEVGGTLTALQLSLQMIPAPNAATREEIKESTTLVQNLMKMVRDISLLLRPRMLDEVGLLPALDWLARHFTQPGRCTVWLTHDLPAHMRLSPEYETAIYRIVQESVTNATRHAEATEISILLSADPENVSVRVTDNGNGYDAQETLDEKALGLRGMKERAELLGGSFSVTSRPGLGTSVLAQLPCVPA